MRLARRMRARALVLCAMCACSRSQPVELVRPDPSTKSKPPEPGPAPTSTPTQSVTASDSDFHLCEPVVRCGFWSKCVWLERVDATHYRAIGGAAKGEVFVRRRHCHAVDGGERCSVHCKGADGGAPCRDGFSPESEACDESAPPSPNSTACPIGDGICGSLM